MTKQHLWLCIWLEYLYDTKDSDEMKYRVRNRNGLEHNYFFAFSAQSHVKKSIRKYFDGTGAGQMQYFFTPRSEGHAWVDSDDGGNADEDDDNDNHI